MAETAIKASSQCHEHTLPCRRSTGGFRRRTATRTPASWWRARSRKLNEAAADKAEVDEKVAAHRSRTRRRGSCRPWPPF